MNEHAVIEAARELVRADESEAMAARHADATARRSAMLCDQFRSDGGFDPSTA
jgi:hypothetical protein